MKYGLSTQQFDALCSNPKRSGLPCVRSLQSASKSRGARPFCREHVRGTLLFVKVVVVKKTTERLSLRRDSFYTLFILNITYFAVYYLWEPVAWEHLGVLGSRDGQKIISNKKLNSTKRRKFYSRLMNKTNPSQFLIEALMIEIIRIQSLVMIELR